MKPISKEVQAAAALLGRRGGLASGPARMEKMTPEARREVAIHAVRMRWKRYRDEKAKQAEAAQRAGTHGKDRAGNGPRTVQKIERAPRPAAKKNSRKAQRQGAAR